MLYTLVRGQVNFMSLIQHIYDSIQTFSHSPSTSVKKKGIDKLGGFER